MMKYSRCGFFLIIIICWAMACHSTVPTETIGQSHSSKVYVANSGSNSISVIDVNSDIVIKTIPTGKKPVSMAFSPDQSLLAVANKGSKDIWLIDTNKDTIRSIISLVNGFVPLKLVFGDPDLLLMSVVNQRHQDYVISMTLHAPTQIDTVARLGFRPTEMVVSRKHRILCVVGDVADEIAEYVPNNEPGTVMNYETQEVLMRATTNGFGAVITPNERFIYINNLLGYFVKWDVVKQHSEPIRSIHTHAGDMVFKQSDTIQVFYRVYPGNFMLSVVSLQDTTETYYELPYDGDYLAMCNPKNRLYIVHTDRGQVSVYDLAKMSITKTIPVGQ
ncbi:MAG: beta-propeller fold lactonase family protein, partial [Aliifodinibius sp.]|nr:beta-propeller fold lactonase family protein [Fodinibius sp.]NIY28539.1 beta-propeller fold lactonase family protein [Fodinibius sp.]